MNLQLVSDIVFALGRRAPRAPFALLRAMPPALLHALRAPGLRDTFRVATRASYYRDAFAAAHVDVARARRPEDLGDFYLTPEVLKTRPEALLAGTPELAIERDRKSTRLNSSHLVNSYAVFCLKKKKRPTSQLHGANGRHDQESDTHMRHRRESVRIQSLIRLHDLTTSSRTATS